LKRLGDGENRVKIMEDTLKVTGERHRNNEKRLKFLKEQLYRAKSKQGSKDEALMLKLEELDLEA
jgi:hypothetical protein